MDTIAYSRDALLQLNFVNGADVSDATIQLPECIRKKPDQNRGLIKEKRSKHGETADLNPSSMITGNVQSLHGIMWKNSRQTFGSRKTSENAA